MGFVGNFPSIFPSLPASSGVRRCRPGTARAPIGPRGQRAVLLEEQGLQLCYLINFVAYYYLNSNYHYVAITGLQRLLNYNSNKITEDGFNFDTETIYFDNYF